MLDFPNGPLLGQTFYAAGVAWEWDGEKWTAVGTEPSGVTGSNEITISDTAPAAPVSGQLWWDSVSGNLFLWYVDLTSSQWVPAMSESGGLGGGYLLTSGGQMTGPLSLYGNATANLQAVPLQQLTTSLGGYVPTTGGTVNGPLTVQGSLFYTATGATASRAAQDRATDIVNVKDYGATGTADDAATFAAALTAVAAGGRLLIPAGSYNIGSALVVAVTGGVTFEGAGSGVTILNFFNSTDGVTFNLSASAAVHVKGMTIARAVSVITGPTTYANTGLTIATAAAQALRIGKPTIEDVYLRGNAARGSGWLTSLNLNNISAVGVDHLTIVNPDASGTQTGTGIFWQGQSGSSYAVDSSFNDISIQGGGVGFSVGNYVQGVYLVNSRIIGVDYGIYWPSTPGVANLWINVANCHFNAGTRGFYVSNIGSVTITNTLFIRFPVNSVTGNWAGIEIDVTYAALIANNIIRGNTSGSIPTAQNGIMLANGNTTTVTGNMITSLDNPVILNGMIDTVVSGNVAASITGSHLVTDTTGDPSNQRIGNQLNGAPDTATAITMGGPLLYTATGGTVARAAQDRSADVFNVKDYGATGNDTTDDTAAIQAAFAAAAAGGEVYFPPGTYVLNGTITQTFTGNVSVCGAGAGVSILSCATNGLALTFGTFMQVTVSGLSFVSTVAPATNTGLAITSTDQSTVAHLNNLVVRGNTANTTAWQTGISLTNVGTPAINDIFIRMANGTGVAGPTGIYYTGSTNNYATGFRMVNSLIQGGHYGVQIGNWVQGVYLVGTDVIGNDYGIYWAPSAGANEWLSITNSHFNCGNSGVYTNGVAWISVFNSLFLHFGALSGGWRCIDIETGHNVAVVGNQIYGNNTANEWGILLNNSSNLPATVTGNAIGNVSQIAINLSGNTANASVVGNSITSSGNGVIDGSGNASNQIVANSSNGHPDIDFQNNVLNVSGGLSLALLINAANDAAAATAGVAVGQLYRNGSIVMQRVA